MTAQGDYQQVHVRIPRLIFDYLKSRAACDGHSLNGLIVEIIRAKARADAEKVTPNAKA